MARVALVAVPLLNTRFPALNIALLAGELKKNGHQVTSFDLNIDAFHAADADGKELWDFRNGHKWTDEGEFARTIFPRYIEPLMSGWVERVLSVQPQLVGISVTPNDVGMVLARALKRRAPGLQIVFGGPMCSKTLGDTRVQPDEVIDAVVSDEGERTLIELVRRFEAGGRLELMPGVTVLRDGRPVYGGLREAIEDLDSTAFPDFGDLDLSLYRDWNDPKPAMELPLYTSRGCVARCNFCMDYKMWQVNYRQKSAERTVDEVEHFVRSTGVREYIFIELIFNGDHRWVQRFVDEVKRRRLKVRFWSHGRIDRRLTPELLRELREAGFWHFIFGLESASDKVLKLMRKGNNKAKAAANLRDCSAAGIEVSTNIIVGYPGEDTLDFLETLIFVTRHRRYIWSVPNITPCYVTPGTDLYEMPEKFGIWFDRASPTAASDWVTLDGKNTPAVRERRRRIMDAVLRRLCWKAHRPKKLSKFYLRNLAVAAGVEVLGQVFDRVLVPLLRSKPLAPPPPRPLRKTLPLVDDTARSCDSADAEPPAGYAAQG